MCTTSMLFGENFDRDSTSAPRRELELVSFACPSSFVCTTSMLLGENFDRRFDISSPQGAGAPEARVMVPNVQKGCVGVKIYCIDYIYW